MAASAGRQVEFEWNSAPVEGVREKGIALNGEAIDITSDDSAGWRELLSVSAQDEVEITLSGVTKDQILKTDWFAGTRTRTVNITYPNGDIISGSFFLASYTDTGPYNDATTFEATLQSTGVVSFTPYA